MRVGAGPRVPPLGRSFSFLDALSKGAQALAVVVLPSFAHFQINFFLTRLFFPEKCQWPRTTPHAALSSP